MSQIPPVAPSYAPSTPSRNARTSRFAQLIEDLKAEYEGLTSERGSHVRTIQEGYERHVHDQVRELAQMETALYDLDRRHLEMKEKYEQEIQRLRSQLPAAQQHPVSQARPVVIARTRETYAPSAQVYTVAQPQQGVPAHVQAPVAYQTTPPQQHQPPRLYGTVTATGPPPPPPPQQQPPPVTQQQPQEQEGQGMATLAAAGMAAEARQPPANIGTRTAGESEGNH